MEAQAPIVVGIGVGLAAGFFWGLVNGLLTVRLRIAPFIVTLGTLGIIRGVTLLYSGGLPVVGLPRGFSFLGEGTILGLPFVLYLLVLCALLTHLILQYTKLGRYAYAIGSNRDAAVYAGIPVGFHIVSVYAISGMLTGLAGMIEASRLMTGQPTAGQGYELQVIAAVVIGGGSLSGGEGSVAGTLIGAFIMGLLANGCDLLGISPYIQQAVIGAVIILAVTLDELRKRRFTESGRPAGA
jgi:ribose transport system permease protein